MTKRELSLSPWYIRFFLKAGSFLTEFFKDIAQIIISIPRIFIRLFSIIRNVFIFLGKTFKYGDVLTRLSFIIMGASNFFRGQIIKGILFLLTEVLFIYNFILYGITSIAGLRNLGTKTQGWVFDENLGIDVLQNGDNSMLILLFGVFWIFITITFLIVYSANLKSALIAQRIKASGKRLPTFIEDMKEYLDNKFYKTMLVLPILGIVLFTVIPLVYMILIAFTNFDNSHQPPGNLFTWIGIKNFKTILGSGQLISKTFWPVLGWTLVWAVFATFLNYLFGIILSLLINNKNIKGKKFWRTIFVLSIAVPQFVTLLIMKNMLNDEGPINVALKNMGLIDKFIPFLTDANYARVAIIIINLWIGIPFTMLITTGILLNIPDYLYESARIDGASPFIMFTKITMPYIFFVTTPYLITQFIGNINNFNVIYLLSGGGPSTLDYYQAGKTDLLVTWLYKLTVTSKDYNFASTIGIIVFVLSAVFSLLTFRRTSAYNSEEEFA